MPYGRIVTEIGEDVDAIQPAVSKKKLAQKRCVLRAAKEHHAREDRHVGRDHRERQIAAFRVKCHGTVYG